MVMEGDETKSPVKIEYDNVAEEERKMLKKLEEEKIKQELEILEIMKAEEELVRQEKLLIEMSQNKEKDTTEEIKSHNPVSDVVEVPLTQALDPVSDVHDDDDSPSPPRKDFLTEAHVFDPVLVHEEENPPALPSKDFLNDAQALDPVLVYGEEIDKPPALPSQDFLHITDFESRDLLSKSEDKGEELKVKNESKFDEEVEEEYEAPPPVPCRDFFDVTVNDEEDSFVAENFETKDSSHLSLQNQEDASNFFDDKGIETAADTGSETLDQTEIIGQIEDQNTINDLISITEEEDCQIEPKQCVEDENEVNNKIVSMLETTMDMMDKRHLPDSEDLISSPENVSENGEKLIDFENDLSTDEGINFEIQHNDDKFENISDYDKANESLLDSPDSQNFSEELNLVAEEAGRKELETSITETKLDDGETLIDNLGLNDGILDTDKNVADCQEAGVATKTVEVTEAIDIDLTDPAVEAAATKIQSAFKGFKTRKKMSQT